MNILGMGPLEILLIVVLALIVFGPARLPEIMGQVGRAIADFRRATSQLSDEFNRTIAAELAETRSLVDDTKATVTGVQTGINAALTGAAAAPTGTAAAPSATAPAAAPPALTLPALVTNGTNGTHTEQSSPPLADTAQWSWETSAPAPSSPAAGVASPAGTQPDSAQEPVAPTRRRTRSDDLVPPY
jgi:TatA/E family protein of Tat protein translocase